MVASSANEAIGNARRYTSCQAGQCLKYTRTWLEIGSYYGDAATAWHNAKRQHSWSNSPPAGAPVFWTGGSHGYGHIALSLGGGRIRTTDAPSSGDVSDQDIGWVKAHWGLTPAGWTEDLNTVTIPYLAGTDAGPLHGIDVSHYQAGLSLAGAGFAIFKATQGTSFVDSACDDFYTQARSKGVLRGVYHFADGGDVAAEADHFLRNVAGYVGDAILVLDWEGSAVSRGPGWAKSWLDTVYHATGVKPLIYMNHATMTGSDWSSVVADYGLWYARYSSTMGDLAYWRNAAIWQHTDALAFNGQHVDGDTFYGGAATWAAYATGSAVDPAIDDQEDDMPAPKYYWRHADRDVELGTDDTYVATLLNGTGIITGVAKLQITGTVDEIHYSFDEVDPAGKKHSDVGAGQITNLRGNTFAAIPFTVRGETGGSVRILMKAPYLGDDDGPVTVTDFQIEGAIWPGITDTA